MFTTVTTVAAVLAVVAYASVFLFVAGFLATRASQRRRDAWTRLRVMLAPLAPAAAWTVAAICMLGSLYLSEIAHLTPCRLCWYQRIAMYPLVLLLGIAVVRSDLVTARRYVIPLAAIGSLISLYHYQLERFPNQPTFSCGLEAPCSIPVVNVWGFASVPFMALAGFLLISALLLTARDPEDADSDEPAA